MDIFFAVSYVNVQRLPLEWGQTFTLLLLKGVAKTFLVYDNMSKNDPIFCFGDFQIRDESREKGF